MTQTKTVSLLVVLSIVLFIASASAYANSIVTSPDGTADHSISNSTISSTKMGQGFTMPMDGFITGIQIKLKREAAPPTNLQIRLEYNNVTSHFPNYTLVRNDSNFTIVNSTIATSQTYYNFTFPTPVFVNKNGFYWIVAQPSDITKTDLSVGFYDWAANVSNSYAAGYWAHANGTNPELWNNETIGCGGPCDRDQALTVFYTPASANYSIGNGTGSPWANDVNSSTTSARITTDTYGLTLNTTMYGNSGYIDAGISGNADHSVGHPTSTKWAQSFNVSSNVTLNSVTVSIRRNGAPLTDMQFRLETDSAGSPSGTLLNLSTNFSIVNSTLATTYANNTYTFGNSPNLTKGTTYWLVAQMGNYQNDSNNYYGWQANVTDVYPNGTAKYYAGVSWTSQTRDQDVRFTYSDSGAATVFNNTLNQYNSTYIPFASNMTYVKPTWYFTPNGGSATVNLTCNGDNANPSWVLLTNNTNTSCPVNGTVMRYTINITGNTTNTPVFQNLSISITFADSNTTNTSNITTITLNYPTNNTILPSNAAGITLNVTTNINANCSYISNLTGTTSFSTGQETVNHTTVMSVTAGMNYTVNMTCDNINSSASITDLRISVNQTPNYNLSITLNSPANATTFAYNVGSVVLNVSTNTTANCSYLFTNNPPQQFSTGEGTMLHTTTQAVYAGHNYTSDITCTNGNYSAQIYHLTLYVNDTPPYNITVRMKLFNISNLSQGINNWSVSYMDPVNSSVFTYNTTSNSVNFTARGDNVYSLLIVATGYDSRSVMYNFTNASVNYVAGNYSLNETMTATVPINYAATTCVLGQLLAVFFLLGMIAAIAFMLSGEITIGSIIAVVFSIIMLGIGIAISTNLIPLVCSP